MVSNISFTSSAIRYLNNEPVYKQKESIFNDAKEAATSVPTSAAFFMGIKALGDRKHLRITKAGKAKVKSGEALGVVKGFKDAYSNIAKAGKNIEKIPLTKALFTGEGIKKSFRDFKKVNKYLNPTFETVKEGGKISKFLSPITQSGIGKALKLPQIGNLCKRTGAGFTAIIDGTMELFTEVGPAFKNAGFKEGIKQLGKSALKVGASTLGWVLGEAGGQAVGAAIGTAICPGIGTAIGGFVGGLFGGMFASNVAGNTVKKATGKSYSETKAEQEQQQQATAIANDVNSTNEVKQAVMQKLAQKQQLGKLDKDDLAMLQMLQSSESTQACAKPAFGSLTANTQTATTSITGVQNPYAINIDYSLPVEMQRKMGLIS